MSNEGNDLRNDLGRIEWYQEIARTDILHEATENGIRVLCLRGGTIVTQNSNSKTYEASDLPPYYQELRFQNNTPIQEALFPNSSFAYNECRIVSKIVYHKNENRIEFMSSFGLENNRWEKGMVFACGGGISKQEFSTEYAGELAAINAVLKKAPQEVRRVAGNSVEIG